MLSKAAHLSPAVYSGLACLRALPQVATRAGLAAKSTSAGGQAEDVKMSGRVAEGGEAAAREGLDQPFSEDEYSAKTDEIPIGSCPPLPSSLHEQRGRPENQPEGSGLDQPFSEDEYARDR